MLNICGKFTCIDKFKPFSKIKGGSHLSSQYNFQNPEPLILRFMPLPMACIEFHFGGGEGLIPFPLKNPLNTPPIIILDIQSWTCKTHKTSYNSYTVIVY